MKTSQPTENNPTTASVVPRKYKLSPPPARRSRMLAGACGLLVALTAPPAHAQTCALPPSDMVAWWPLDETTGTAVADVLGQNNGTASGQIGTNSNPKSVPGFVGNAMNFYFGSHVSVSPKTNLDFGTSKSFTIDAWIKSPTSPIVSNFDLNAHLGYFLYIASNGKLSLELGNGTPITTTWSGPTINPSAWTFVAVVVDRTNNTVTFYASVGSTLPMSVVAPPIPNTANASSSLPLQIGGCPGNPNGCYGIIDEVEIFNRALTQAEIQRIFNAGSAGKCKQTKGMTWMHTASNAQTGTITVGCAGCDAYHGDTVCTQQLPLLCIYKPTPPFSLPTGVNNTDQNNLWSGGVVATTPPIAGNTFAHISATPGSDANSYCAAQFGPGWRVAEFHDGWGWNFQAYGGTVSAPTVPSTRFWVHINDQPAATCWQTP
jgi:Concanavalin A-like lectin/glucanases superfamily